MAEDTDYKSEADNLRRQLRAMTAERDAAHADRDKLSGTLDDLRSQLREAKDDARERKQAAKDLEAKLAEAEQERDDFALLIESKDAEHAETIQQYQATPDELQARIGELSGKLRQATHDRAYERIAKAHRVSDPAKLADLIALARYTPEADDPDEEKIGETFAAALKGRSWLLDPEPSATPTPTPTSTATPTPTPAAAPTRTPAPAATARPGPGADRGASVASDAPAPAAARIPGRI